ncbi:MAG: helix-turn-helix domain-containing protein [Nitrospirota bacterium]
MSAFLTYEELSERWKIAVNTLRQWVMEKKLVPLKFGNRVRFPMEYILEIESKGGIR